MGRSGLKPTFAADFAASADAYRSRIVLAARAATLSACAGLLAGCASPGPPRPPSLHLPAGPASLTAERIGSQVVLRWKTSAETTDGELVRGAITAVVCRGTGGGAPPGGLRLRAAPACDPVQRFVVQPGECRTTETLPRNLAAGAPSLLFYEVELLNEQQRSAGPSAPVFLPAGAAPPALAALRLAPRRQGVEISWAPATNPDASVVRLTRTLLTASPGSPAAKQLQQAPASEGVTLARSAATRRGSAGTETTVLSAAPGEVDRGGLLDAGALDGGTYQYVAQRIERIALGGQMLELAGEPSSPLTIVYRDIFPPPRPTGLAAVPGGGFGQPASIDLSWDAGVDRKTVGYNVYRAEPGSLQPGSYERRNGDLVVGPAFRDLHVAAGSTYRYRVTAVDASGNESQPTNDVQQTAEKQ